MRSLCLIEKVHGATRVYGEDEMKKAAGLGHADAAASACDASMGALVGLSLDSAIAPNCTTS
jgi:hypothetical protein